LYWPEKEHAMILVPMMVFEVSLAMVIGFVLGRIWQIRYDLEQHRDSSFTLPATAHIPQPQL
jgi:hypothetical protein